MERYIEPLATERPSLFGRLAVLGDPLRCRMLMLLEGQELSVSEICRVLQLPQSTASRHLKTLADDGLVVARRDGTSRRYSAPHTEVEPATRRLWQLLREEVASTAGAAQDRRRLHSVLAARRTRSQQFFSSSAGRWARLREELFGRRFDLLGLLALLDEKWTVGDLGCGTGQTARSLAPFVERVIAVDDSEAMLDAARLRLDEITNVELRQASLESLPIADASLDVAVMVLVLHHLPDPPTVLMEASRALKPKGKLLVVDMLPHEHEDYRQEMGHVWLGFDPARLSAWLAQAGFDSTRSRPLAVDPEAKGPSLFATTARRSGESPTTK